MAKSMVIVESPAKARTIERYLGKGFTVRACAGHIKDLPSYGLGVNIRKGFHPTYKIVPGKEKIVKELKRVAAKADKIYLAADPDREGEAICQHLAEELNGSDSRRFFRVLFNEITKGAILKAFEHPQEIDRNKVEAQQTRRILDRLVGYKVSPLLWQKVRSGLSAGRVQSVALRLVVDREKEIRAFVPVEYWNFTATLRRISPPSDPFEAKAVKLKGKKFKVSNQEEADKLMKALKQADFVVESVRKKERKKRPVPPFITSTLQQDASRKLRFSVKKTMTLAQRLYEGVEMGQEGHTGLITYMRTDSTRVSQTALQEVREYIGESFGIKYLPDRPAVYRTKKGAQDAHEAIRPTSAARAPEQVKSLLGRDEYRLYQLIWKRFVASQMKPALFDQTDIDVQAAQVIFRAVGSILRFDGFLRVYQEGRDEAGKKEGSDALLPDVKAKEGLAAEKVVPEQKFTQPPPRYSEATLVKALEEKGIGRPSTYAQTITVIQSREYVGKEEGRFVPSHTGEVVSDLLVHSFPELFDYDYTAKMEQRLDEIENGKKDWVQTLERFYDGFSKELLKARKEMKNLKKEEEKTGIECDKCGQGEMVIKWGRFGRFMACSRYPECKNTRELTGQGEAEAAKESVAFEGEACEKCGSPMVLKKGRYGEFLACTGYPECKNTKRTIEVKGEKKVQKDRPLEEPCPKCGSHLVVKQGRFGEFTACSNYPECRFIQRESTGVQCPECGQGEIVEKRSRRGKSFWSCNRYPDCKYVLWSKAVPQPCPECKAPFLLERNTKKEGLIRYCKEKECGYKESVEEAVA